MPDLLILEDARTDSFTLLGSAEPADTGRHVVHGRSRDPEWSDVGFDPFFVWWAGRQPDRLTVSFRTGGGGILFSFRVAGDSLIGSVDTDSDRLSEPSWHAAVTGKRVRCPAAPAPVGRLRLTIADSLAPPSGPLGWDGLVLTTERQFECGGQTINYEATVGPDTVAVLVRGTFAPRGRCNSERGPATTDVDLLNQSRRVVLLIKHEGDTNRFIVDMTDSSIALRTERATTVIADERERPRLQRNRFVITCGARFAHALCNDLGTWLTRQAGLTRIGVASAATSPYTEQVNEDVRSATFRYQSAAALQRVRACVASVAQQIRATDGVYIRIMTSMGEELTAASEGGNQPVATPIPTSVTANSSCGGIRLAPAR